MCSIAGVFGKNVHLPPVEKITFSQSHRGPDKTLFMDAFNNGRAGLLLGASRLSIVGGKSGDMPFRRGNLVLAANAEVYNFKDLMRKFPAQYAPNCSDLETIPIIYGAEGAKYSALIKGQYFISLFDATNQNLYLSRDPFAEKPGYFFLSSDNQRLYFASKLHALIEGIKDEGFAVRAAMPATFGKIPSDFPFGTVTRVDGIYEMPPGITLRASMGSKGIALKIENTINFDSCAPDFGAPAIDETELKRISGEIRSLIDKVAGEVISTVATLVAVKVSGGVDSSAVAALAKKYHRNATLFCFDTPFGSEYEKALAVANKLSLPLIRVTVDERMFLDALPIVIQHLGDYDWKLVEYSVLSYYIARAVKQHNPDIKVLLNGDGVDEVFGGYPYHAKIAASQLSLHDRRKAAFGRDIETINTALHQFLQRADATAAAFGLESRAFFLHPDIAFYALKLPLDAKVRGEFTKYCFRMAVAGLLPDNIRLTPKQKAVQGSGIREMAEKIFQCDGPAREEIYRKIWSQLFVEGLSVQEVRGSSLLH